MFKVKVTNWLPKVYGHFGPKTFRHWCRSVSWTLGHQCRSVEDTSAL